MYALGMDIGVSSVRLAAVEEGALAWTGEEAHRGGAAAALGRLLDVLDGQLGLDACAAWMATGSGAEIARGPVLGDVPALARGLSLLAPDAKSAIAIGGQSAYYVCGMDGSEAPQFAQNE
ncbi:MAG: hypothetical protein IJ131_07635, partial [Eggerthellaceae bacterium]|nr:hypothetical protein [Eggerthellaceae bacterium]